MKGFTKEYIAYCFKKGHAVMKLKIASRWYSKSLKTRHLGDNDKAEAYIEVARHFKNHPTK